jgi:fumarate reductase (CoM/CoB) subunit A
VKQINTDVLVIGTGGAGLYAAIRAADEDARVTIWDKGLVGKSGSTVGGAGVAAVGPWSRAGDSADVHFRDTLLGGSYLNDQLLVRILVEESPKRIIEMEGWGLRFDREPDGSYVLDRAGGHSYPRLLAISDRVGLQMTKVLQAQLMRREVERVPDVMATRLLTRSDAVVGAMGLDLGAGDLVQVNAPAVVLATGGVGQIYPITSNPVQCTGDGLALAYRAGARLTNMEQVQFYPSGLVHPPSLRGFILGIQEYAALYNAEGKRFMARYEPDLLEHTTRDRLARAIQAEIAAGRSTEHGGVYLDATDVPEETFRSFQHELELCQERGFDLRQKRVEVAPAAHYFMGGVAINHDGHTSLPGLWAAGEVSGGAQGGNRLSGNSLAGILVFGARAGASAARYAHGADRLTADEGQVAEVKVHLRDLLNRGEGELTAAQGKDRLRQVMGKHVGVVRNAEGLETVLEDLAELENYLLPRVGIRSRGLLHNRSIVAYLELENMVSVAQLIAQSALVREESRGSHFRDDFPEPDHAAYPRCTVAQLVGRLHTVTQRPIAAGEMTPEVSK